jgi:hypothetical protein
MNVVDTFNWQMEYFVYQLSMTGGTPERKSQYEIEKERALSGGTRTAYTCNIRQFMTGKSGAIRSTNRACIEGTLKMVISVGQHGHEGSISIPSFVAKSMCIPDLSGRYTKYRTLKDGDYGLLVRQPCLWSGGLQPVRIVITDDVLIDIGNDQMWNTNCTIKLPPGMCDPYGADFDGDEMTLFPVTRASSLEECKSFK